MPGQGENFCLAGIANGGLSSADPFEQRVARHAQDQPIGSADQYCPNAILCDCDLGNVGDPYLPRHGDPSHVERIVSFDSGEDKPAKYGEQPFGDTNKGEVVSSNNGWRE